MIVLQTSSTNAIHRTLLKSIDGLKCKQRRDHHLLILSCYIDFDEIKLLLLQISTRVRLIKVHLAFEYYEAFRSRLPNEMQAELTRLSAWCKTKKIKLVSYALRTGTLMHAKGYALLQPNSRRGIVCVGSSNATLPGLGLSTTGSVNIELAQVSSLYTDLTEFLRCWKVLKKHARKLSEAAHREDEYGFAYALLASGIFLHDWRGSIGQQLGIRYTLTERGQKQLALNDPELQALRFKAEQVTISFNPFSDVAIPRRKVLPRAFTKNYTIDTLLGRWCPRSVWHVVAQTIERDDEFKNFLTVFRNATEPNNLKRITKEEEARSRRLAKRGVVTSDIDRVVRWQEKIDMLRDNTDKLARIFMNFEPFEMPYDYQSRHEVKELRDSLFRTMAVASRRFLASKKVFEAEKKGDLDALTLTNDEQAELEDTLGQQSIEPWESPAVASPHVS